jgi:hypothetical protein
VSVGVAARLLYPDALRTVGGPDGGLDVSALGAVAEVKCWRRGRPVPAPVGRALRGVAWPGQQMLLFSTSGFTRPTVAWADSFPRVALFQLRSDGHAEGSTRTRGGSCWTHRSCRRSRCEGRICWRCGSRLVCLAVFVMNLVLLPRTVAAGLSLPAVVYYGWIFWVTTTMMAIGFRPGGVVPPESTRRGGAPAGSPRATRAATSLRSAGRPILRRPGRPRPGPVRPR